MIKHGISFTTAAERREICWAFARWPEVRVTGISDSGGLYHLILSCKHVTARRRRVRVGATVVCEQCAARDPRW